MSKVSLTLFETFAKVISKLPQKFCLLAKKNITFVHNCHEQTDNTKNSMIGKE